MMKKLFLFTLLAIVCYSCTKNEYISYTEKDGLSFTRGGNFPTSDSIVYSFVTNAVQGDSDTLWVPIALTGLPAKVDRPFRLQVAASSNAQEGVHYTLPQTVFPADSVSFQYPIVLLRSDDLMTSTRQFTLQLAESDDFSIGALSAEYYTAIRISVTDQAIKPSWWAGAENYYYGQYSNAKYRFMIEVCGIANFSNKVLNYPQILNYRELVRAALKEYEKTHGTPLRDENNLVITI